MKVPGFQFAGVTCGLKVKAHAKDLGLVVSERPARVVGMFTTNQVKAAPVLFCERQIKRGHFRALVVNSGNANACTGSSGDHATQATAASLAKHLQVPVDSIYVCSTGKIGVPLPLAKVKRGLEQAVQVLSPNDLPTFSQAIMTTDRFPKIAQVKAKLGKTPFTLLGVAKGAGMIEPHMATMLAFILTDLNLNLPWMRKVFREVVEATFNSISVDGDCSTNDTALWIANGKAANSPPLGVSQQKVVKQALYEVCHGLAKLMVADGEGATKVVKIIVKGAATHRAAKNIAYSVARSFLVKTAFFGEDPNWGRILAAVGYSGETLHPQRVDISIGSVCLVKKGQINKASLELKAHKIMKSKEYQVKIDLNIAQGEASLLTSDLTVDYVKLNSEYRT